MIEAPFTFRAPTAVRFGRGVLKELPVLLGTGRWGLISSPSVLATEQARDALDAVAATGQATVEIVGTASPNPKLSEIESAWKRARDLACTHVLAIGGGSAMDAAKVLRAAIGTGVTPAAVLEAAPAVLTDLRGTNLLGLVPSAAGTGAETSKGAIITDDRTGTKRAARGEGLLADWALVDPNLMASLSVRRTVEIAFDVIAHATETFLSRAANPVTDLLARETLRVAPAALLRAARDTHDLEARELLALHSTLMGYNLANASTCLPHRMQYPVGSRTDTSHQVGLAALYPAWLRALQRAGIPRAAFVRDAVAASLADAGLDVDSTVGLDEVFGQLLEGVGMNVPLATLGLNPADARDLARSVEGRVDLDPLQPDSRMIERIFADALAAP